MQERAVTIVTNSLGRFFGTSYDHAIVESNPGFQQFNLFGVPTVVVQVMWEVPILVPDASATASVASSVVAATASVASFEVSATASGVRRPPMITASRT